MITLHFVYNRSTNMNYFINTSHYIEDLLNREWITKSQSSYASPVVCVRKKDGGLRLCIDYRELNRKTVRDRHPIPRIQETLDNLVKLMVFSIRPRESISSRLHWERKQIFYGLHHTLGLVWMDSCTVWTFQCTSPISKVHGRLLRGDSGWDMHTLLGWRNCV